MSPIVFGTNRSFKRWNTLSLAKELFIKDSLWRVARVGKSHKKCLVTSVKCLEDCRKHDISSYT